MMRFHVFLKSAKYTEVFHANNENHLLNLMLFQANDWAHFWIIVYNFVKEIVDPVYRSSLKHFTVRKKGQMSTLFVNVKLNLEWNEGELIILG